MTVERLIKALSEFPAKATVYIGVDGDQWLSMTVVDDDGLVRLTPRGRIEGFTVVKTERH